MVRPFGQTLFPGTIVVVVLVDSFSSNLFNLEKRDPRMLAPIDSIYYLKVNGCLPLFQIQSPTVKRGIAPQKADHDQGHWSFHVEYRNVQGNPTEDRQYLYIYDW